MKASPPRLLHHKIRKTPLHNGTRFCTSKILRFFSFQGLNADNAFGTAMTTKTNHTCDLGIDGVITAHANILAHMETGTMLAHDDAAGGYNLTVVCFGSQSSAS